MTKEQTIQLSIEKWEDIVNHQGIDDGGNDCALCHQYILCLKCPIHELAGKFDCRDTPYQKWIKHQINEHPDLIFKSKKIKCKVCEKLAKEELEFLKSLLQT